MACSYRDVSHRVLLQIRKIAVICWLWSAAGGTDAVAATVYRWVDAQGRVHFSDNPREAGAAVPSEVVTVVGPQMQPDAEADQRQRQRNYKWFERRTRERQSQEALKARAQAKLNQAQQKWQQQCDQARQRLKDAEMALQHEKRTGFGITPAEERKRYKHIRSLQSHARQACS